VEGRASREPALSEAEGSSRAGTPGAPSRIGIPLIQFRRVPLQEFDPDRGRRHGRAGFRQQPPVKVNVLNVCAPSADEQKELSSALAKVPGKPAFSKDFEVARGHSTLDPTTPIPGMQPLPPGAVSAADWCVCGASFPTPPSSAMSNTRLAWTRRIWWKRSCCACAIRRT